MRTCVCGYGLVRHPSSLPTLVERVVAPAECGAADVYCHTWSDVTAPRDLAALAAALPGARIVATPQAEYDAAHQDDYGWLDAANVYVKRRSRCCCCCCCCCCYHDRYLYYTTPAPLYHHHHRHHYHYY